MKPIVALNRVVRAIHEEVVAQLSAIDEWHTNMRQLREALEIQEARRIIERLPSTRDGIAVIIGMEVWTREIWTWDGPVHGPYIVKSIHDDGRIDIGVGDDLRSRWRAIAADVYASEQSAKEGA